MSSGVSMGLQSSKSLKNGFDVVSSMNGHGARPPIPLKINSEEEMQPAEVTHLEFVLKARLQLVHHVYIAYQNDEVININYYNHNVIVTL